MDTVISNKYSSVLNELDIEVSKKLEGEYTVDEIISQFKNFFFNKMFYERPDLFEELENGKDIEELLFQMIEEDLDNDVYETDLLN